MTEVSSVFFPRSQPRTISFSTEIWHHKLLTIQGVIAGWASLLLLPSRLGCGCPTKAAPKILFRSGGNVGFEGELMAEAFQPLDVITGQTLRFETVEKIAAQVSVARP